jgi:tetratricopeptide (TPR) repeat protein
MKDFFISYTKADRTWAEWIAWTLEETGYSVVIQAWDFRPGENFVLKMQEAIKGTQQTIAVLSENYLDAFFTQPEWAAAFARDPEGEQRALVPVRIGECQPEGLLQSTIHIDLVGRSEVDARKQMIEGVGRDRAKPDKAPMFPGHEATVSAIDRVMPNPVPFPGAALPIDDSSHSTVFSNLPTGVPFFTGREEVLTKLHEALKTSGATALAQRQAISGLGGIGKTQTAIEYARRHRDEYKALLWAVAESRESLISDFMAIAGVLHLPEVNAQDQTFVVKAVKRWLETNSDWLLILDNADDPVIIGEFLPENSNGHLLLTSRAQVFDALGILNPIELEEMAPVDARDFLLRRTGRHDLEKDEAHAVERLAQELDYLPLALEQAGAYIKELRSTFEDYLTSYHKRGLELLEKGQLIGKYRKSVRTTWSLNFQQVEQASLASADLLRVSAFLNPDRIPAELISLGAADLGSELPTQLANVNTDPLVLDEVLQPLIQYSLIHRDRESRTYDIHRLVQAVLQDGMDEPTRRLWAERVVKAVAHVFPDVDAIDVSDWPRIERLLVHAQACAEHFEVLGLESQEAAYLLNITGRYLHLRGRLGEAELLYDKALSIREKILGANNSEVATSLHNRAWLFLDQGKYVEGERLFLRALETNEALFGPNHEEVAKTLVKLARLYTDQGNYADAERVCSRLLQIGEELGEDSPVTPDLLGAIVALYLQQWKGTVARPFVERALRLRERTLGREHYKVADSLNDLGIIHYHQGNFGEAEPLFLRSIAIYEASFGPNYPALGAALINLAFVYREQEKYQESEILLARALEIHETGLGPEHPKTANPLLSLGSLYSRQGRYTQAEPLFFRALSIQEKTLHGDGAEVARTLVELGRFYKDQRKYVQGEPLLRRAMPILKEAFGFESTDVVSAMFVHASLLKGMNRKGEAQRLEAQAKKIQAKFLKKKRKR